MEYKITWDCEICENPIFSDINKKIIQEFKELVKNTNRIPIIMKMIKFF
jgi:hypothetical protein